MKPSNDVSKSVKTIQCGLTSIMQVCDLCGKKTQLIKTDYYKWRLEKIKAERARNNGKNAQSK